MLLGSWGLEMKRERLAFLRNDLSHASSVAAYEEYSSSRRGAEVFAQLARVLVATDQQPTSSA